MEPLVLYSILPPLPAGPVLVAPKIQSLANAMNQALADGYKFICATTVGNGQLLYFVKGQ